MVNAAERRPAKAEMLIDNGKQGLYEGKKQEDSGCNDRNKCPCDLMKISYKITIFPYSCLVRLSRSLVRRVIRGHGWTTHSWTWPSPARFFKWVGPSLTYFHSPFMGWDRLGLDALARCLLSFGRSSSTSRFFRNYRTRLIS